MTDARVDVLGREVLLSSGDLSIRTDVLGREVLFAGSGEVGVDVLGREVLLSDVVSGTPLPFRRRRFWLLEGDEEEWCPPHRRFAPAAAPEPEAPGDHVPPRRRLWSLIEEPDDEAWRPNRWRVTPGEPPPPEPPADTSAFKIAGGALVESDSGETAALKIAGGAVTETGIVATAALKLAGSLAVENLPTAALKIAGAVIVERTDEEPPVIPPAAPGAPRRQVKRDMAEYVHTEGTGTYKLRGAIPPRFTLRSGLRDHARIQYRVTSRDFQEIGRGEFLWATNEVIRREVWVPGEGPVDWGPGRKLLTVLDS